jgi:putative transposase
VDTYGEVVVEDLDLAAMKRSMGRRAFRRSVGDAGLGAVRRTLAYKAERGQTRLTVADRFFTSTKLHHGCGGTLVGKKLAKILTCELCGEEVDRDHNAAKNLRDWPETHASPGAVGASALSDPGPPEGGTDGRSDVRVTDHRARLRKTSTSSRLRPVRREPKSPSWRRRNPARGASE